MTELSSQSTSSAAGSANGTRDAAQIEADIEVTRERLVGTIDEITERVHPANLKARAIEAAKAQVIDPVTGQVRTDRVAAVAGVVVVMVAVRIWRSRRSRRS